MKNLINIFTILVLLCTLSDLSAQVYLPGFGTTVYKTVDGNLVLYQPTTTGSEIVVIGGNGVDKGTIDCTLNPSLCRGALEDADAGNTPDLPDEPAGGGDDEKPDDEESTNQSGPSSMQVYKEYRGYAKQNKGRMYHRSKSGKWNVVKDRQTMHKKILMSIKKR